MLKILLIAIQYYLFLFYFLWFLLVFLLVYVGGEDVEVYGSGDDLAEGVDAE